MAVLMIAPISEDPEFTPLPVEPVQGSVISSSTPRAVAGVSGQIPAEGIFSLPGVKGQSCVVYVEAAAGAAAGAVLIRLWMDGTVPTTEEGIPLKAGDSFEIKGYYNLQNTYLISADGLQHTIHVQYSNI